MSVKTRITLLIAAAGFLPSLLFSVVVFYELVEQPFTLLDDVLKEEAYHTAAMIVRLGKVSEPAARPPALPETKAYWVEVHELPAHQVIFRSELAKSVRLAAVRPGVRAIGRPVSPTGADRSVGFGEPTYRIRAFSIAMGGRSFVVQIARSMEKLNEEIRELVLGIISGLFLSTLALIAISRFIAGRILRPIAKMKDLAQDISEKNLDRRIPHGEGRDEFSALARTINRMLDRLQYSFMRQRGFLFDTSHELKTPLTTMRLAIDEIHACDGQNLPPLVSKNLFRLNNQLLRMDRLVKDLLNLSSLEAFVGVDREPVQLNDLLLSLAGEYRFLAEPRRIQIDTRLPEELLITGDRGKLQRAFSNLLDNALKYNVDGGRIVVTATESGADVSVAVANTGPAVAEEDIPMIFDQFYRVEKSRSTRNGGFGLGLSIVRRIVELHGGVVRFESGPDGWNRVTVSLPRNPEARLL